MGLVHRAGCQRRIADSKSRNFLFPFGWVDGGFLGGALEALGGRKWIDISWGKPMLVEKGLMS